MLNENDAIKRKLRWAIDVAGVTRDAMQTSTGVRSRSGVSEWLRTGRIAKKHLPILAQLTATSDRWWLTPDAPIPPSGDWLVERADVTQDAGTPTPQEAVSPGHQWPLDRFPLAYWLDLDEAERAIVQEAMLEARDRLMMRREQLQASRKHLKPAA
jgi:hypothetical protein